MARALPTIASIALAAIPGLQPFAVPIIFASAVVSGVVNAQQARRQRQRAIAAGRRDNVTMVRSAEEPHRIVYGEARVSGPIAFSHSTGEDNGSLYLIVCLAAHKVAAIKEILFNETQLGVTGGSVLNGSSYFLATLTVHRPQLIAPLPNETGEIPVDPTPVYFLDANLSFTLPVAVNGTLAYVSAVYPTYGQSPFFGFTRLNFSTAGNVVTVNTAGAVEGMSVYADWSEWTGTPLVDVASYLGTDTQAADADLMGASGGRWTAAHQLKGIAYVRARLVWNLDRFIAGAPNISGRVEGWEIYDPRTDTTEFTKNSALCIRHYLLNAPHGLGCDAAELDEDSFIESANTSDEWIVVDVEAIANAATRFAWQRYLDQAVIDGTWQADRDSITYGLVSNFGDLVVDAGGSIAIISVGTVGYPYAEPAVAVTNASSAFSTYVQMPELGSMTDGRIDIRMNYPGIINGVGFSFRTANIGVGDSFDGYRIFIDGTGSAVRFFRSTGTTLGQLGIETVSPPTTTTPVTLGVDFTGGTFRIYYQGELLFTATDPTPYTSGTVRLLAYRNPPGGNNYFFDVVAGGVATVFRQRRYTCNGSFTVDRTHENILSAMLSSCAGQLVYTGGVYRLVVGAYRTPTLTLTEDDFRGPITVVPRKPYRELFNTVRGVYAGKSTFDVPTDFSPVTNATYKTQDGGEEIATDLAFEFTNDSIAAQRIAKIHLEKHRRGLTVQAPCTMKAIALRPGDTVMVTVLDFGWAAKVFRVEDWTFRCDDDFGIDLVLQEEDAASYDWDYTAATLIGQTPQGMLLPPIDPSVQIIDAAEAETIEAAEEEFFA